MIFSEFTSICQEAWGELSFAEFFIICQQFWVQIYPNLGEELYETQYDEMIEDVDASIKIV